VACRARSGLADVRNYLSTEWLRQTKQTDVFVWHGHTGLWLDGAWRKATPAFSLSLCDRFGLLPLKFDGVNDALHHPLDRSGQRHTAYVPERGCFNNLPLARSARRLPRSTPDWSSQVPPTATSPKTPRTIAPGKAL
jgi:hypothetical protein